MQLFQYTDQCLLAVRNRGAGVCTNDQYVKIPRQAEALLTTDNKSNGVGVVRMYVTTCVTNEL